jgi:hypothetical protein
VDRKGTSSRPVLPSEKTDTKSKLQFPKSGSFDFEPARRNDETNEHNRTVQVWLIKGVELNRSAVRNKPASGD